MIIQHNIPAINSHRNLGINNNATAKNLEKLSSGYKINRAGDDAAGLAISEKMRGQIRGLAMAEQNTQNGISLIQTAEGGLNETHAILQRMRELAVQASNGTYQNEDREQIDLEFDNLKDEITRIAESTHYNGIKLLDGALGGPTADNLVGATDVKLSNTATAGAHSITGDVAVSAGVKAKFEIDITGVTGIATNDVITVTIGGATFDVTLATDASGGAGNPDATDIAADIKAAFDTWEALPGNAQDFKVTNAGGKLTIEAAANGRDHAIEAASFGVSATAKAPATGTVTFGAKSNEVAGENVNDKTLSNLSDAGATFTWDSVSDTFTIKDSQGNVITSTSGLTAGAGNLNMTFDVTAGNSLVFQIGANGGQDQRVFMTVDRMASDVLGLVAGDTKSDGTVAAAGDTDIGFVVSADVKTVANANRAIEIIHAATNQVSAQRAELGALQNRLEHTLNNLGVTKENLTAAESVIRDVDMAKEMMEFTKNNILVQASQAMLAQATQLPQGVLQLLR